MLSKNDCEHDLSCRPCILYNQGFDLFVKEFRMHESPVMVSTSMADLYKIYYRMEAQEDVQAQITSRRNLNETYYYHVLSHFYFLIKWRVVVVGAYLTQKLSCLLRDDTNT